MRSTINLTSAKAVGVLFVSALVSASAWSAACFVLPKGAAEFQVKEGTFTTPTSTSDCNSIRVKNGLVKAMYFDKTGAQSTVAIEAGGRFTGSSAQGAPATMVAVAADFRSLFMQGTSQTKPGRKYFDNPEDFGLPYGQVYVPADGLKVVLKGGESTFEYQLFEEGSNKPLMRGKGQGQQPILITKTMSKPNASYKLMVKLGALNLDSQWATVPVADENELVQELNRISADDSLDEEDKRVARALIYEDRALGYNRRTALVGDMK